LPLHSSVLRSISSGAQGRVLYILIYQGDWPDEAIRFNLSKESDLEHLQALIELTDESEWKICQFKNKEAYNRGPRLVGQHRQLFKSKEDDGFGYHGGIRIGKFQGLVEPLGYRRLPLSEGAKESILQDHQSGHSVTKMADDWDVSESHIRAVITKHKPSVSPLKKPINKGSFEGEPPLPSRVAKVRGGSDL
jgi:hypothetical protein